MNVLLATRLIATRGWRWMPGMASLGGYRVILVERDGYVLALKGRAIEMLPQHSLPDLGDAATVGCVVELLRAALGDPMAGPAARAAEEGWIRWAIESDTVPYDDCYDCGSEAEALVLGLEIAR